MSYKAEQIEKGALRKLVSKEYRKALKRAKKKKTRKTKIEVVPTRSKYDGWSI
jgi:hypothetical protein